MAIAEANPEPAAPLRRIALFVPVLSGGGVQRVVLTMSENFLARGYAVDLLVAKAEGPFLERIPEGAKLVELGTGRGLKARFLTALADPAGIKALARPLILSPSAGPALRALPGLVKYLKATPPDVLFAAKVGANLTALLGRKLVSGRFPVVVSERVTYGDKVETSKKWRWRYAPDAIRRLYPEADAIVAVSHGTADGFRQVTGRAWPQLQVIYNPVVGPKMLAQAKADTGHPWFERERDVPVILGVGRLEARKGFDLLLRAFAKIREEREVRLVILGEGEARSRLETLAQDLGVRDAVDLPGWKTNPFSFMAKANLFVLPSDYEGLPGVLIQALACGAPVVATDCPSGPREILEDGRFGGLVPVRDEAALLDAMKQELNQPHPTQERIERGQTFTEKRAIDTFERLFQEVRQALQ